jgi:hypothetical protein
MLVLVIEVLVLNGRGLELVKGEVLKGDIAPIQQRLSKHDRETDSPRRVAGTRVYNRKEAEDNPFRSTHARWAYGDRWSRPYGVLVRWHKMLREVDKRQGMEVGRWQRFREIRPAMGPSMLTQA